MVTDDLVDTLRHTFAVTAGVPASQPGELAAYASCGVGIIDLDSELRVLGANDTALQLLCIRGSRNDTPHARFVAGEDGRDGLRFVDRNTDAAFGRGVRYTSGTGTPVWLRIPTSAERALAVLLKPLRDERQAKALCRAHVLNPYGPTSGTSRGWCALWSLTDAECRVAAQLLEGHSATEIARAARINVNTVRFHIKNLLSKTSTSRQSQLLLALSRSSIVDSGPMKPESANPVRFDRSPE